MNSKLASIFITIIFLFTVFPAVAGMYTWKDENGVLHVSDTPPQVQEPGTVKILPEATSANDSQKEPEVEIFTTSWCRYCKEAVAFLDSKGIRYVKHDIEKQPWAKTRMKKLGGGPGVPFAVIYGEKVKGFSETTYTRVLGL